MFSQRRVIPYATLCLLALSPMPLFAEESPSGVEIRSDDGKVLIAADQIRSYDWTTHTMNLVPNAREELAKRLYKAGAVSGKPFEVTVGEQIVYTGTMTSIESSRSFATPVIVVDAQAVDPNLEDNQLRIQLGYPSPQFFKGEDPRADQRVRTGLKRSGKLFASESAHTKWIVKLMHEMQTIKPGMTRGDLLEVFEEEGGLSTRTEQRYVNQQCPYIKVKVEFDPVDKLDDKLTKSPHDKIKRISTPFLEWSIND